MGLVATKPFFGVSDQIIPKTTFSATETCQNIELSLIVCFGVIHNKCADQTAWMRRLVCDFVVRQVFSRRGPIIIISDSKEQYKMVLTGFIVCWFFFNIMFFKKKSYKCIQ